MKKLLSIILAILMIVTTIPIAFAADETPDFSDAKVLTTVDGVLYIDGVEAETNSSKSQSRIYEGKYILEGDIETSRYIWIFGDTTLDLNGYTWNLTDKYIIVNAPLSVYDTSEAETGKITSGSSNLTININNVAAGFNLYGGTIENTSSSGRCVLDVSWADVNLYAGKIKSNSQAISFVLGQEITLNIDGTVLESGDDYADVLVTLGINAIAKGDIDVTDYKGDSLTAKVNVISTLGKITVFKGIKNTQEAEKYQIIDVVCNESFDLFWEKTEYDEATGEKSIYTANNAFTQQPSADNNLTVDFNNTAATFQWYEVEEKNLGVYTAEECSPLFTYEFKAGDILKVSTDSEIDFVVLEVGDEYLELENDSKTATIKIDTDETIEIFSSIVESENSVDIEFSVIKETALEGETEKTLQKVECGKSYYCKATVGENVYVSDNVNILSVEHNLIQVDAQAPTCTEIGWDAYEYCTACDYTTYVELPVDTDAHDWSNKDGICARENCGYECVHANYADGACDNCDVKQKYTVRMETKLSKGVEFVGNPVAIHGEDLIIEFKNLVSEKCNDVSLFELTIGANSFYEFEFDENGITFDGTVLTIPGELVNGDVETHANAYTQARIKLNGGKFSPECPPDIVEEYFIENDYAISNKMLVGYNNSVKDTFVKDKHTIKSILASDGNDYNKIYYFSPNSDLEMTIEWECLPENFENGVCVECGYECPHEWSEGVLTRPTKTEEGYYTYSCEGCGDTKTEIVERADYSAYNEALEKVKGYLDDESLTDYVKEEALKVVNFFELDEHYWFIKGEDNVVAERAAQIKDFIDFVEEGIADGSAVKVDGSEIVNKMLIEWGKKIEADGLADAYIEFIDNEKATEEAMAKDAEIQKFARSLEGSVAENADNIEQLEGMVNEFLAYFENCLNGAHNVREYKVIEAAKCGENAVEEGACWFCGEGLTREVENSALTHSFTKYEVTEEAKCGVEGKEVAYCDNGCSATDEKAIDALTHTDADGDYKCDNGCGHEFEKPAPEEPTPDTPDEPNTPDEPDTPDEPTDSTCDHLCHKSGILGFFWKIVKFFSKLFKINPVCECGAAHY